MLGALACLVLLLIATMVVIVFRQAWPSFAANGLAWFGSGGEVTRQLEVIFTSPARPDQWIYELRAFPLLYGTALTTGGAVVLALAISLLSAIFIVEFAPQPVRRVLEPVVRLLAAVPSVIYGLIGVLVLVPFLNDFLISEQRREEVKYVVSLSGKGLLVATMILTIMITPIMIAIIVDALRAVPRSWIEGSAALGVNRWRTAWKIGVRAARPAIVAAAVLATARALGEAIMLAMVAGRPFAPNPLDGLTFFFEPTSPLGATIVSYLEGRTVPPLGHTLNAFAAVLLVSSMFLSLAGWAAKQPLKRYGVL